jgi:hypothetical protein
LRADDLHADWQPFCCEPGWGNGRRQIDEPTQPGPEQVVDRRLWLAVDLDHALPALALVIVIVRIRRPRRDRAEKQIIIAEEISPFEPQPVPLLTAGEPIPVREGDAPHHAGKIAPIGGTEPARDLDMTIEDFLGQPTGGGRAQQLDVDGVEFRHVDVRPRPIADPDPLTGQEVDQALQNVSDLAVDLTVRIVEHNRDAVVGKCIAARRSEVETPARRFDRVGSRYDVERKGEILGAARQGPDNRDVRRRDISVESLAARRCDAPARLVAPDTAVMRRIADRAADIAADLEPGQPSGECSRGTTRGSTRRPRPVPGVVRRPINRVVALRVGEQHRYVGLAENDGSGGKKPVHRQRIRDRDIASQLRQPPGGRHPNDIERFLDGHRQAVQSAPALAAGERSIRRVGAPPCSSEISDDDRVERRIVPFDARQKMFEEFAAADLARADRLAECRRRSKGELGHDRLRPHSMGNVVE